MNIEEIQGPPCRPQYFTHNTRRDKYKGESRVHPAVLNTSPTTQEGSYLELAE
jgi:hypothetical protein